MGKQIITIRCFDNCVYELAYPEFFLKARKLVLRKLFTWLYRFDWKNSEAIEFAEREFPNFVNAVQESQENKELTKSDLKRAKEVYEILMTEKRKNERSIFPCT